MKNYDEEKMVSLSECRDVDEVLNEMTLQEKLCLLTGGSGFGTRAIPRLGIPAAMMVDSAAGINLAQYYGDLYSRYQIRENLPFKSLAGVTNTEQMGGILRKRLVGEILSKEQEEQYEKIRQEKEKITDSNEWPTCFPTGMLLASTWNPDVVEKCGMALGKEAKSLGVNVVLGTPDANIQRDPRGGRVFECYTEDPCLMSKMAPAMVRGIQSQGVFADVKHFAANNQETSRLGVDENISERALREIYFPGFKACVKEGKVKTVMGAYNCINGVGCSMNKWLLTDVLRNEWGFEGIVMSDWGGVYDQIEAIRAGNDIDMPGIRDMSCVEQAVTDGRIMIEEIDACVRRVLRFLKESTLFEKSTGGMDREFSNSAAYEAALEGIVLLKNENSTLPLKRECKISLFGKGSTEFYITGKQSSRVFTDRHPSLSKELEKNLGENNVILNEIRDDTDYVILTLQSEGTEGKDRENLDVDREQCGILLEAIHAAKEKNIPTVLLLNIAAPVDIREFADRVDAVMAVYYPGSEGAHALVDILLGMTSPSGHLTITYPQKIEDCPAYGFFPGKRGKALYNEDIYVGYRYYDLKKVEPLYPFGYGLSYTKFDILNARLDKSKIDQDVENKITLCADVRNVGEMAGKCVVQVYLHHRSDILPRPIRELKAFQKVLLQPGERRTLKFELNVQQLAAFDPGYREWIAEAGEYIFEIGTSSRDLPVSVKFHLTGHTLYDFGLRSSIKRISASKEAFRILQETFEPYGVTYADFADCLKYFPDKELGVIVEELINNKHLNREDPELIKVIEQMYKKLTDLPVE